MGDRKSEIITSCLTAGHSISGRTTIIDGRGTEIVGVLDRDFISPKGFEGREPDIWITMDPRWERYFQPDTWILEVYGRVNYS